MDLIEMCLKREKLYELYRSLHDCDWLSEDKKLKLIDTVATEIVLIESSIRDCL